MVVEKPFCHDLASAEALNGVVYVDRHTGEEVVSLLEALNASGVTLIVVTHDQAMGARARRQIVMEDGRIEHDGSHAPG